MKRGVLTGMDLCRLVNLKKWICCTGCKALLNQLHLQQSHMKLLWFAKTECADGTAQPVAWKAMRTSSPHREWHLSIVYSWLQVCSLEELEDAKTDHASDFRLFMNQMSLTHPQCSLMTEILRNIAAHRVAPFLASSVFYMRLDI